MVFWISDSGPIICDRNAPGSDHAPGDITGGQRLGRLAHDVVNRPQAFTRPKP